MDNKSNAFEHLSEAIMDDVGNAFEKLKQEKDAESYFQFVSEIDSKLNAFSCNIDFVDFRLIFCNVWQSN